MKIGEYIQIKVLEKYTSAGVAILDFKGVISKIEDDYIKIGNYNIKINDICKIRYVDRYVNYSNEIKV